MKSYLQDVTNETEQIDKRHSQHHFPDIALQHFHVLYPPLFFVGVKKKKNNYYERSEKA